MITDKDIKKLKEVIATKQDLVQQAKSFKQDLVQQAKSFKQDLVQQAVVSLQTFATKQDLEQLVTRVEFEERFDEVVNKLDAVYGEVRDMRQEQIVHLRGAHDRIDEEITTIEKRLDKVEAKVFS